jgi:hypothetical protein
VPFTIHWFQSIFLFVNLKHTKKYIIWLGNLILFKVKNPKQYLDLYSPKKQYLISEPSPALRPSAPLQTSQLL